MPSATVGDMQFSQGGLLTQVKNERLNHLVESQTNPSHVHHGGDLPEECTNDTVLVSPFGLSAVAHTLGLCL